MINPKHYLQDCSIITNCSITLVFCNKMKYLIQLLYIVFAIYLNFVAWIVSARTAVSQYSYCDSSMYIVDTNKLVIVTQ